ncbi:ATP-dependent protease La [Capsaspora owczarzaki ATCC 30864]|uniref:Lon protease homolog n=1 Tax=Capsaspora owczarzaki (strain ATCC 30864) TaxID=595528 RepID=A0A0D2WX44_CAPO3|nr:ATP-dependent protease La [Capsaspora owczarzaki ATCC 30864]KJE97665.1 ATP-dependent protease La [Capsaspora owczarzaki ATCC 30864]|eukprot:XP_004342846.1 ATP-dependent protease La [Capsaspora owczarzaki ATCC 30864]
MAASSEIPSAVLDALPLLTVGQRVLLPGALMQVFISRPAGVRLVTDRLWRSDGAQSVFVGVLPVAIADATATAAALGSDRDPQASQTASIHQKENGAPRDADADAERQSQRQPSANSASVSSLPTRMPRTAHDHDHDQHPPKGDKPTAAGSAGSAAGGSGGATRGGSDDDASRPIAKFKAPNADPATLTVPAIPAVPKLEISATPDAAFAPLSQLVGEVGTIGRVVRLARIKVGSKMVYNLLLEGQCRFGVVAVRMDPFMVAQACQLELVFTPSQGALPPPTPGVEAMLYDSIRQLLKLLASRAPTLAGFDRIVDQVPLARIVDLLMANMDLSFVDRVSTLRELNVPLRFERALALIQRQVSRLQTALEVPAPRGSLVGQLVKMARNAKDGKTDDEGNNSSSTPPSIGDANKDQDDADVEALETRIKALNLPEEVAPVVMRELAKLKRLHPQSSERQVYFSYLEVIADLPWNTLTEDVLDLQKAQADLDHDHHGLAKVKKRILECLAVRKLRNDMKGPIICLVGPPGVGKTSLGRSIASTLGRKFQRIALGGMHDEAEIRGHRLTYVGAMPGRVMQAIRRSGSKNPVLLLDEIDKLGKDVRGDPASALLEVLDPEQNCQFSDHYLHVPFDLSKALFICTANRMSSIPAPLLDRMEVIELPGYTLDEKAHIATRHLIPKQLKEHGLVPQNLDIPSDIVQTIIQRYTREAGVRNLEREIAAVCRATAVRIVQASTTAPASVGSHPASPTDSVQPLVVDDALLEDVLGAPKFDDEIHERVSVPGVATGLVWTANGGGILFVEATSMGGKGRLTLTGQLGDVIKESAQIALTWLKAHATALPPNSPAVFPTSAQPGTAVVRNLLENTDIHVHFPAGAIPKDGPSAGITLVTVMVSLMSGKVVRADTAMTGEVTLSGLVLPVGGIKEKVIAAHRAGIKRVILPHRNSKDLAEIPATVKSSLDIVLVKTVQEVLDAAFDGGSPLVGVFSSRL